MTKEEAKQYIRNLIDSSLKCQSNHNKNIFKLSYNKSYLSALKLSKITGQPVNKEDFKGGDHLIWVNTKTKKFWIYDKILDHLSDNYSTEYDNFFELLEEVITEYEEYKGYKY